MSGNMAIANILSKLGTREKDQEQFLAIEVGAETVSTAVWKIAQDQTQIVSVGTIQEWEVEKDTQEKLLKAIDISLEKALTGIESEPNKVIYGLQESWVDGSAISKKYANILKQITEKFEFDPIGFVVTTEAIVQLLKLKEGTPPTAILIRVSESEVQISLINLGKVSENQIVSRSEDIGADLEEGLARSQTLEKYPSRMLLLDGSFDLDALKQDILSYNWLEKLPFLHFPKVEILDPQITIHAVAIAGGAEAAKALGFKITKEEEEEEMIPQEIVNHNQEEESVTKGEKDNIRIVKQEKSDQETILGAEEIGFSAVDVSKVQKQETAQPKSQTESTQELSGQQESQLSEAGKSEEMTEPGTETGVMTRIKLMIPRIPHLPKFRIPHLTEILGSKTKVIFSIIVVLCVLIGGAAVYGYWTIPKAKVVLYVKPKSFDKEVELIIDPTADQINPNQKRIPGKVVEVEVESGKEKDTTGTRVVGEKAQGEVTIYNKTSAKKTFPVGTKLIGPNNLTFTLDAEVTAASASSEESDEAVTTTFGKTKTGVTAIAIGAEFNVSANTQFQFDDYSSASYEAKNDSDLTGGTSREVQAISQDDIDGLLREIEADLKQQAEEKLQAQEGPGRKVLIDGAEMEIVTKDISGDVGVEAQKVSAKLRVKMQTVAYEEQDLMDIIQEAVSESIPDGFQLNQEESKIEIKDIDFQDPAVKMTIVYKVILTPKIDEQEIRQNLKGKYPNLVESYFSTLPNFSKAQIEITPESLPVRLKRFPRKTENIAIEVKVEQNE